MSSSNRGMRQSSHRTTKRDSTRMAYQSLTANTSRNGTTNYCKLIHSRCDSRSPAGLPPYRVRGACGHPLPLGGWLKWGSA
eukprot:2619599-Pyramimonas_sp.AAC.1